MYKEIPKMAMFEYGTEAELSPSAGKGALFPARRRGRGNLLGSGNLPVPPTPTVFGRRAIMIVKKAGFRAKRVAGAVSHPTSEPISQSAKEQRDAEKNNSSKSRAFDGIFAPSCHELPCGRYFMRLLFAYTLWLGYRW
jgi:hypothetical protein